MQHPETKEYIIVVHYANRGSLLSYLEENFSRLTWKMRLYYLKNIACYLHIMHNAEIVHCDLHGGNIGLTYWIEEDDGKVILENTGAHICNFGHSQSVNSHGSKSTIQGVLPSIAPEVFHTCKFTKKSDIYSFGIIMYLIATGEPPFRNRQFDRDLVCDIMGGLRPSMPDSVPEEYKKLAEQCCDADPDKRPDILKLLTNTGKLIERAREDNTWNAVYHNDVKPLSRLEKESKYSSMLLPTGDLLKPRNSPHQLLTSHQLPPLSDFSLPSSEVELEKVGKE